MTETLSPELEAVVARAAAAAPAFAATRPEERARAIVAVADSLEAHRDELVAIAMRETGLTEVRLAGEVTRTAVQLRLFADTLVDGGYLGARIDHADTDFALGVRPDIRRTHLPVGPVINFSASNFPFAFSVMGGDSAAVLAAGCPLIVKAHSGHPELSDATAAVATEALAAAGMPEGTFQLIHGREAGVSVLKDPRIKAGAFTGSIAVGRLLADIAASRPAPIPFFGELGSVNPVFVTADAIAERAAEIAEGFLTSVSGSAGQLCTKPGFVFAPAGSALPAAIQTAASDFPEHRLLDPRIARSFDERRNAILGSEGVTAVLPGGIRFDEAGHGWATPTIVSVPLDGFRASAEALAEEAFGPLSIVVEVPEGTDLAAIMPEFFEGNLTGTLHLSSAEASGETANAGELRALVAALSLQVGRVLFNGWSTGVAVTPAQQHGGPWPATTNDASTSVGTAAITRFMRPVAYQNAPAAFLPEALRDENPAGVPQAIAPAGESKSWGARWR
ncbi:aldehyde dehydrogenase family protein [Leucobacter chromiireducens]|uniref:Aldehyde dehydrogenase family protein n=1 Tax=Leucobacter chromiireducens subsp. chromiireducens TaxID=660067 RepID=A0ABS1SLN7_9MICO|nr:aldehyde dehydrogenase family protein [Leucobacter chromiireducens]MBL3689107.1 aldehyde dehydrogenase family protein [Leucobacter chromiireducens subsp. chromiireducens]